MGSCCSKRSRRDNSQTLVGVLHPSLENWKVRKRSSLSEFEVASNRPTTECIMPVMRVKPPSQPPFGFPSIHYNVNANLLCDSNHSSSRSLGGNMKNQSMHLSFSSSNRLHEDNATIFSSQHISAHHFGISLSSRHHDLPDEKPENEVPPSFSFATQPYVEPDFFNMAFAFHPTIQNSGLAAMNINSTDGVKLKVRHKHMFPQDILSLQGGDVCSHELPTMKRSRSDGKIPAEERYHNNQPHRRSFQETFTSGRYDPMIELSNDSIAEVGASSIPALIGSDIIDDSVNDEDEDGFHDINLRSSISGIPTRYVHANEQMTEDIKYCITMEASSHSKADFSREPKQRGASSMTLAMPQKTHCVSRYEDEWLENHERKGEIDNVTMMQPLAVVSTGDAVLFSGSNLDELHLIPSKFVCSPPTSPRVDLSPLKRMASHNNEDGDDKASNLSIEDIISLLESDDVSEDELLSLLINTKSPSMSPTALSPSSMLSISSLSTTSMSLPSSSGKLSLSPMSLPSLSLSSSSSSSSSPPPSSRPRLPCPAKASMSSSQSWFTSMPAVMLPFSTPAPSASRKALPQNSSSRKVSPTSSFEFKVKSCSSAVSTPMFSPIRSTAKRNIAQLKPTALTTEEIAEIWGVFEQRQAFVTRH